jgi:cobalt-zinc-cadmium efflux system protein
MSNQGHCTHKHSNHNASAKVQVRLLLALLLTSILVVIEFLAGTFGNSLALMSDAVHNLTDVVALGLSFLANRMLKKPPNSFQTYGYHRVGILVAVFNSMFLIVLSAGILFGAWERYQSPGVVSSELMILVGGVVLFVNLVTAWLTSHGAQHDLNVRSAFLHMLGDVLSSLGAILAGVGIYMTGWNWLDPAASVLISVLILWNAWLILHDGINILLEAAPKDVAVSRLVADMMAVTGVQGIHDLHIWSLSSDMKMLTAHIFVDEMSVGDTKLIQQEIAGIARLEHRISHVTLQFESDESCGGDLYCGEISRIHGGRVG